MQQEGNRPSQTLTPVKEANRISHAHMMGITPQLCCCSPPAAPSAGAAAAAAAAAARVISTMRSLIDLRSVAGRGKGRRALN